MSRRSARPRGKARVAVVGAESPAGTLLRKALAERRIPGAQVGLFGATGGEAVLSEYAGEARLIQDPDPDIVNTHDVIFLCENGDAVNGIVRSRQRSSLVIDLVRAADRTVSTLIHPEINGQALEGDPGCLAVPHPLGIVLAELLHPLNRSWGVRQATAVVLRPASDFGDAGVEELREQTVRLLSFAEAPKDVFGRQLAFNLIPQRLLQDGEAGLERSIAEEVTRLLDWDESRLAVRLVTVAVFYGHGVNLRVELEQDATPAEVTDALSAGRKIDPPSNAGAGTPVEATGEMRTTVTEVYEDGLGGYWVWAVVGEAGMGAAEQAVRLAESLGDL